MTTNPNHQREVLADGSFRTGTQAAGSAVSFEPFINKPEVARRLGKRVRTVDNWMQQGLLPYYKIGRSVAFKWSEVEVQLRHVCRVGRADEVEG